MKKIFILFLIMLFQVVHADLFQNKTTIASFINEIPEINNISCKFKQEKIINGLSKPIVSGGNFKFIKNDGVYFYTTYPIKTVTSYKNNEYRKINEIIQAISDKKYKHLENEFDFYFEKQNNIWKLGLIPTEKSQTKFLKNIQIEGVTKINKIIIVMQNGNKITQWFQN